jgi:amyloid beta precursor protein binding protein 1
VETLTAEAQALLGDISQEFPDEWDAAVGEMYATSHIPRHTADGGVHSVRAPDADLPNTAAFLGGLVAQESIKMITRQYIPVQGYCVVDLVDSWTGVVA